MIASGVIVALLTLPAAPPAPLTGGQAASATPRPGPLGPCDIVVLGDGRTAVVANHDAAQLAVVDLDDGAVRRRVAMPAPPTGLAPAGVSALLVTCAAPASVLIELDTRTWQQRRTIALGHSACAPVVMPDSKRLMACNRFDDDVATIDLDADRVVGRTPMVREPVAAATPDGRTLVVANHLPAGRADTFFIAPVVTQLDIAGGKTTNVPLPDGANSLRGVCVTPDGRWALVTHVLSNYALVPSQVVGGWTNTNVVSLIDVATAKLRFTVQLDDPYLGAANPWDVACSADGRWLCVTHAGTHELSVIDLPQMLDRIEHRYIAAPAAGTPNHFSVLRGIRRRVALDGVGPRAVTVVGSRAIVACYFSDTLHVVDLADAAAPVRSIALGPLPQPTPQRRGEMLFHDATICYQHWQSCATCHPDARADALNWDLQNDGVGNPKNTKSMLLAHRTPPAMSTGVRSTAEAAVRSGMKHILFAERPERDTMAIDAYLKSLRPAPSPHLVDGHLSAAARRGRRVFDAIGCADCHPRPYYTDRRQHDVGTQGSYDFRARFDTPTLIEAWRTAPYLHDGRCATIAELLLDARHGLTAKQLSALSDEQRRDLVEFVLSL